MKKTLIAALSAISIASPVQADVLGVYLGAQVWDNQATGIVGESGHQTDFNFSDEQQGSFFVSFEHPLPLIPNAMISMTSLDTKGSTTLTSDIDFDDQTFTSGSLVDANFDVSYVDYTVYYEIFDNDLFVFDIGITGRDFDGTVDVSGTVETMQEGNTVSSRVTGSIDTDEIVPMIYAATTIGLPFTGFNIFAQGNFLSLDDHTHYDYQAGLSYELIDNLAVDVDLTIGYRAVKLELQDMNNLYSNLDFKGVFAGATIHF